MQVLPTRGEKLIRRRRGGNSKFGAPRPQESEGQAAGPAQQRTRRHEATPTQDQALYTCSCGYVFEAQVCTSVGCPHCGDTQAW